MSEASFFWYDYETTGIDPKQDRLLQFAGIRTDLDFNVIDKPIMHYAKLSAEIVPHVAACLITGILPEQLHTQGISEREVLLNIHQQFTQPNTCIAGYNNIRFDDEFTRFGFYRHFLDPYAWGWQNGNSRWDLLDVLRLCSALRPDGIKWPRQKDDPTLPSYKLEEITKANQLTHTAAHDALSDVYATLHMAKLLKQKQPQFLNYILQFRNKKKALTILKPISEDLHVRPVIHASARIRGAYCSTSVFLPLIPHPLQPNVIITWDLRFDPTPLFEFELDDFETLLYTPEEKLSPGTARLRLKEIAANRAPALAPLTTLTEAAAARIAIDVESIHQHTTLIVERRGQWIKKLEKAYRAVRNFNLTDVEGQLYTGFLENADRLLCQQIHRSTPEKLAAFAERFSDTRMPELLFRYRARNFPETLTDEEQVRWDQFVTLRREEGILRFQAECLECNIPLNTTQNACLEAWAAYLCIPKQDKLAESSMI
jgi:exodeoxyribonuclease-1